MPSITQTLTPDSFTIETSGNGYTLGFDGGTVTLISSALDDNRATVRLTRLQAFALAGQLNARLYHPAGGQKGTEEQ